MTDSKETEFSPTYPPTPYAYDKEDQPRKQESRRLPQTSAYKGRRSTERASTDFPGRVSFDEDTEALLHATDEHVDPKSPTTAEKPEQQQQQHPRSTTASRRNLPDVFARPLTNAGYRTPSNFLVLLGIAALVCLGYLLSIAFVGFTRYGRTLRVNVILMVSDGFGPTSETMARDYITYLHNSAPGSPSAQRWQSILEESIDGTELPLDALLVGQSRTRSSNSLVTDSAAGATAFSCARKTYNGGLAVDPLTKNPCGTVLEAAKHKRFLTGLVTTSRITHATPAAFYAHIVDRDLEEDIAAFLVADHPLGLQVDYALGGGKCFFLPQNQDGSCRTDDKDLFEIGAKQQDHRSSALTPKLVDNYDTFSRLPESAEALGTVGLFNKDHLNYEVDRAHLAGAEKEPSLKEMTSKALKTLRKASEERSAPGFFLMVEGSRIDMAAHSNDPVAHIHDILAYQETVQEVKAFVDQQNKDGWPTVMVSVSDHETGGLSLGTQLDPEVYPEYRWFPDALNNATSSSIALAQRLSKSSPNSVSALKSALEEHFGLSDASSDEIDALQNADEIWQWDRVLSRMLSSRAEVGWSTHGHSGADVGLYVSGYKEKKLKGSVDNTEIGRFIADVFEVDLEGTTSLLLRTSKAWHEKDKQVKGNTVGIQHYHGHDALSHGNNSTSSPTSSHLYLDSHKNNNSSSSSRR